MKITFRVAGVLAALPLILTAMLGGVARAQSDNPFQDLAEQWEEFQQLPDEEKLPFLMRQSSGVLRAGASDLAEPQRSQVMQVADLVDMMATMGPEERAQMLEDLRRSAVEEVLPPQIREMAEGLRAQIEALGQMSPEERRAMAEALLEEGRSQVEDLLGDLLPFGDVRERARRAECMSHLRQIGVAWYLLTDRDGKVPAFGPDFFDRIHEVLEEEGTFVCPSVQVLAKSSDHVATSYETWSDGELTEAKIARLGGQIPVAWDAEGNHEGVRMVLFADAHVEELTEVDFEKAIEIGKDNGLER